MSNNGSQEQSGSLPHKQHPTSDPIRELGEALQAGRDEDEAGPIMANVTGAKHCDIRPGLYPVKQIFDDGISIIIDSKPKAFMYETKSARTEAFVDAADVANFGEIRGTVDQVPDPDAPGMGGS